MKKKGSLPTYDAMLVRLSRHVLRMRLAFMHEIRYDPSLITAQPAGDLCPAVVPDTDCEVGDS